MINADLCKTIISVEDSRAVLLRDQGPDFTQFPGMSLWDTMVMLAEAYERGFDEGGKGQVGKVIG